MGWYTSIMAKNVKKEEEGKPLLFTIFLIVTAFVCGSLVMVVEILGSRVIGPFFGVSLFVWTSLITVTLVALATGYAVGGVLSDRRESPDFLYGIILAAGLLVLAIPAMRGPVLKAAVPLGLRSGALFSSFLLFGPSLMLMGCVSPYLIKVAAREMENIGRTVGLFYAVSTTGSFVGTIATGFVLITWLGVNLIFQLVGGALIFLSVTYFVVFRRRRAFLILLIVPFLPLHAEPARQMVLPNGASVKVVYNSDSFYGNLKAIDYDYGTYYVRELAIDGLVQGGIDIRNGQSIYGYPYFLEFIPYALNPGGRSCLVIGLGAGAVPMWYERKGVSVDVVDIDPDVVTVAREYFGFSSSGTVAIDDARYFLLSTEEKYDFIILDVFSGDTTPGHLLSLEALQLVKERMAPGAVLAANIIGSVRGETFMTASVIKTFQEVFPVVECYPTFSRDKGEHGNMAVIAYDGKPRPISQEAYRSYYIHPLAAAGVRGNIGRKFEFPAGTRSIVLTDDYNPIDFFDVRLKETLREEILRHTASDLLI